MSELPIVPRSLAEIRAEYWRKELDKLQPMLRYSMHVHRELDKARRERRATAPSVPSSEGEPT